jgi:hypothetical protein
MRDFEAKQFPALKQNIWDAAGFEMPIEVDFAALGSGEQQWSQIYFEPLIEALKEIASDDVGQDELHDALKKIVITNKGKNRSGDRMAKFEKGVLTLDHEPSANPNDFQDRRHGIRRVLEANL